ncbi:MAG: ThuA domain-containing protein [Ginsengibacter sp.]
MHYCQVINSTRKIIRPIIFAQILFFFSVDRLLAQNNGSKFQIIAFYTAKNDLAHISFVHEANNWFDSVAAKNNFTYDSTNNWNNLNEIFLEKYQVVLFLDTRPDSADQRIAFQKYMEHGGAFMGFHFAGFALTPSDYPQNWDWYHNDFLGAGQYKGNTWRPVSAILRVEHREHPAMRNLPATFKSAPCEWYSWEKDLCTNKNIDILLSVDSSSFPLGTGPKPYEIWHSGYYPIAWANKNYKMIYVNMGHNDMDYERKFTSGESTPMLTISSTFSSKIQNQFIINSLLWLGNGKR